MEAGGGGVLGFGCQLGIIDLLQMREINVQKDQAVEDPCEALG